MTKAEQIIEGLLPEIVSDLINLNADVTSCIAETNATGFYNDYCEITNADFHGDKIVFSIELELKGERDTEKPYAGDRILVSLNGEAISNSGNWKIDTLTVDSCEIDFPDPE
jgi:hypothetical protein